MPSITQKETSGRRKWEKTLGSRQAAAMVTTKLIPNAVAVLIAVQSIVLRYRLFMFEALWWVGQRLKPCQAARCFRSAYTAKPVPTNIATIERGRPMRTRLPGGVEYAARTRPLATVTTV